jgi:hypothetical protein
MLFFLRRRYDRQENIRDYLSKLNLCNNNACEIVKICMDIDRIFLLCVLVKEEKQLI